MRYRLTVARLLGLMVPLAAYLALFVRITKPPPSRIWSDEILRWRIVFGIEVILLAVSGVAFLAYRRPPFLGGVVQLATTPLAVHLMMALSGAWPWEPGLVILWAFVLFVPMSAFLARRMIGDKPGTRPIAIIGEGIEAGLANLGMIVMWMMCCLTPTMSSHGW